MENKLELLSITKKQLALVRQSYREDGGAERFMSRLLSSLGATELRTTLITRSWKDRSSDHAHINIIVRNPISLGRLTREWSFSRAVRNLIQKSDFDIVQTNERIAGCDVYRAGDGVHRVWLDQKSRVQSTIGKVATNFNLYHLYLRRAEKKLFEDSRLSAVVCNSIMVKNEILSCFRISEDKIQVIYNGVDSRRFCPEVKKHRNMVRKQFGISECALVFLFVGSGFERKGLRKSIEAISGLDNAHLVVIGKAKRKARYLRIANRLGCTDRLHFGGVATDVRPFYGMADALVLPTLYDPFPNVVLEAMACALPVITSASCGAVDIIESERNGFICDALDDNAIRIAMIGCSDPVRASAIGRAARQTILPMTPQRMQDELLALYKLLLETK